MSLPVRIKNDLLDSLSPLSIKLKRLQWKKVMKKKFWKKHRISRSCISLICRQLLNIELQMKRHKAREPLSAIEENKSSHAEPKIRKLDRVPEFEESTKSPHKKLKQGNENYPAHTEKDQHSSIKEKNDFDGFESDFSSQSLKKRKNEPLKSPEFSTKSFMLQTQTGVKYIKVKAFPLSKSKSLHTVMKFKPTSNLNSFHKSHSDSEVQPPKHESQIKSEEFHFNTSVPNGHNGPEDTEPSENLSKVQTQVDNHISPEQCSLFKKNEHVTKREIKYLNGMKQTMADIVKRTDKDDDPSMGCDEHSKMDPINDSSPNVFLSRDLPSTDTKEDNLDSQEEVMPKLNAVKRSDSSESSNNEKEEDSMAEDDFLYPSVNPANFLECNLNADAKNQDHFENSFTMSQNFQLNCDVRVLVTPLLVKDITNTFCYHNKISGISGFRIRRRLQDMNFKGHIHYAIAKRFISHIRTDAHNNIQPTDPQVESSDNQDPPQPSVMDPFTHCVFESIISRERKLMKIEKKKSKNKIPLVLSQIFKPGSLESQAKKSEFSKNSKLNIFKVALPHPNSSPPMNILHNKGNSFVPHIKGNSFVPGDLSTSSGSSSHRIALIPNSSHFLAHRSPHSSKVDALMPIKITDKTVSGHHPHISLPSNSSNGPLPPSTCSYVLVPQGFQVRGSHVLYKPSHIQSAIKKTSIQPHPDVYKTNGNGLSAPNPLITPPSGEHLASTNPFSSKSHGVLGHTNVTLPHNHFPLILHSTLSGPCGPTLKTTSSPLPPNCGITMNGQRHSLVSRHSNQPLFASLPIRGTHPLVNVPSHSSSHSQLSIPSHGPTHPLASIPSHGPTPLLASIPSHGPIPSLASIPSHGPTPPLASIPSHGPIPSLASIPSHGPIPSLANIPSHGPTPPLASIPSHGPTPPFASIPSHGPTPPLASIPSHVPIPSLASIPSHDPIPPLASIPSHDPIPPLASIPSHGPTPPLASIPSHGSTPPLASIPSHGPIPSLASIPSHGSTPLASISSHDLATHLLASIPAHGPTPPLASIPSHDPATHLASVPSHDPTPPLASIPSHDPATHHLASIPSHDPTPPQASIPLTDSAIHPLASIPLHDPTPPLASNPSHGSTPIGVSLPRGPQSTLSSDVEVSPFSSPIPQGPSSNYAELTTRPIPHLVPTISSACPPISNQSPLSTTTSNSTGLMTTSPISIPHNQGPPPLKLGNSNLVKSGSIHSISQPPQLKKMLTQIPQPQLPQSNQSRLILPVGEDNWDINIKHVELRKWLLIITQGFCDKELEVKNWNDVISWLKAFISFGFSTKSSSLLNAAYQMLLGSMCCPHHTAEFIRKSDLTNHLHGLSIACDQQVGDFLVPAIPIMPNDANLFLQEPHYDLFVLKRFVFAVERETRVVLFPLPPSCIPKDNANFDKITVVILISPRVGLGPGLIVFPHSFLDRHLRLSLGDTGSLGCDWVAGAHQRGGLTQSMMIDFLNGQGLHWILDTHRAYKSPQLAVDWWFCIEMNELNSFYSNFSQISLPLFYPSHRDPLDACLGTALTNMWGILVHNWKSTFQTPLTEDKFPKFIYKTLDILCDPKRLQTWCEASGLQPVNYIKSKAFQANDSVFSC